MAAVAAVKKPPPAPPGVEIVWHKVPRVVRAYVEPALRSALWLLPSWCHRLTMLMSPTDDTEGTQAGMIGQPEYRKADIKLFPNLVTERPADLPDIFAEEIIHVITEPLARLAEDYAREATGGEGKTWEIAKAQIHAANEGIAADLLHALRSRGL